MNVERMLRMIAGFMILLSVALGHLVDPRWYWFHRREPAAIGVYELVPDDDDPAQGRDARIEVMPKQKAQIPEAFLESIAQRFRAMGEPSRLRILQELMAGERSVKALVEATGMTQSNTSRHLQALYEAALVGRRKAGLEVIYFVADPMVEQLCELMCSSERRRLEEAWREAQHA